MSFLTIEKSRCQGHGRCYSVAPDLLSDDEQGYVAETGEVAVPAQFEAQAEEAVNACPEIAIRRSTGTV
ncbi:ferredoxin [Rhodococcus sp. KBS0724]|jgi:ferredoxin|uniref:ferredoxin n=1 Tax=Rhodococcus sp. KBS0724 TaxID=1179674 RepID=UPI00110F1E67|nr:ferredoxin [Rhodococcus sp. KBS0724]TSD49423.1 ferredoxin [Rhodococcus sp. KBS0724]